MSQVNAVKNKDGIFINTELFREEAKHFLKYGYYCPDAWGSPAWIDYWQEQLDRCKNGYSSGGVKITGHHYSYMNFGQIKISKEFKEVSDHEKINKELTYAKRHKKSTFDNGQSSLSKKRTGSQKIVTFPNFWSLDYNYFHVIDIARWGTTIRELRLLGLEVNILPDYLNGGYHVIIAKSRRKGFEQPHSELIMTKNGYTTMGDVKIGDKVLSPDGSEVTVINKFPQGIKEVYEVELYDGRKVRCGLNHLWEIYGRDYGRNDGSRTKKIVTTKMLLEENLKPTNAYKYFLKINEPIQYEEKELPIPPYTLGAILGDGNVTKQFKISGIDNEIFDNVLNEIQYFFPNGEYKIGSTYKANKQFVFDTNAENRDYYKHHYRTSKFANRVNPIYEELKKLNLNCGSKDKYIPNTYKYGSIKQRLNLVKGMMDTDGYISKDGSMTFCSVSKTLVKDLQFVLYSLGISSTFRKRLDGLYTIYINTNENIFGIKRKSERIKNKRKNRKYIPIVNIKKLNYLEQSSCIMVDSKDHLYLTRDFIPTHNSYKSSFIAANTYNTVRDSITIIGAFDNKYLYPEGTMRMASDYLNFFNEHTGWVKARDYVDKVSHKKASYGDRNESGVVIEKGYKSQIIAVTFKDNPDAAIGKDGTLVLFEEGGKFNNLKEAYLKTRPAMEDGIYTTGQIIIYGTSGDMDAGTIDFAEMFYSPEAFKLLPFENIWDKSAGANAHSGMFIPDYWNKPGFIDDDGNSDNESALQYEIEKRQKIVKHSVGTKALNDYISQFPFSPEEAFSTASTNDFPVVELRKQLARVRTNNLFLKKGQAVSLYKQDGKVRMKPDLKGELSPIAHYPVKDPDITGSVVIFEAPIENIPQGLYKMGYDPYRQDQSSGVSLGACYVYKSRNKFSYTGDTIVAEYVGRPASAEAFHRNVLMLAELYHCKVMYENEVPDVKTFFKNERKLHLLAAQPDGVISKHIKNSTVNRVYGIHMNSQLKDAGAKYIKKWLLTERNYDENENKILNLETIYSPALLEELISFNLKGNFDRVMAYMQVMFQIEEDSIKEYSSRSRRNEIAQDLLRLFGNRTQTQLNYG